MHNNSIHIQPRDHGDYRKTTRETLGEKNCGDENIDKRRVGVGGVEGGGWCEREHHKEDGEEPPKVDWTCQKNGRGTIDEESGCAWSGG